MKTVEYALEDIQKTVAEIWPLMEVHKIVALHGDLGAGKTTFVSAVCRYLQVAETPGSPTFSLINQYTFNDKAGNTQMVYHADWYRLHDEEEARNAGMEDMLQSDYALCIIEWPEKAASLLPSDTLHLYFRATGDASREITVAEHKIV